MEKNEKLEKCNDITENIDSLLKAYEKQTDKELVLEDEEAKAYSMYANDGGCCCCPLSGDDQFECCQLGCCASCVAI